MSLYSLGMNHHSAPLPLRERMYIQPESLPQALKNLIATRLVPEAAILSTCNRTEVYCRTDTPQDIGRWLADFQKVPAAEVLSHLYIHPQREAVRHVFRVASGLDSMVLGEPQIFGQIKQAARIAEQAGTLGTLLHRLFQRTFAVAKEVRSTTAIGEHVVSVSVTAVRLTQGIVGDLARQKFLFIGAGEMIGLCLAHFHGHGARDLTIANRTLARSRALATRYQARTLPLHEIGQHLHQFDVVVSCTASPLPILGLGMVEQALRRRRHKIMVMVDLAVPRDIEPQVGERDEVFLYTLDHLASIAQQGAEKREAAAAAAESLVDHRVLSFMQWMDNRQALPTLMALRGQGEKLRQEALQHATRRLNRGDDAHQVLQELSQALTNKLLHGPTLAIQTADKDSQQELLLLIERVYQLPDSNPFQ